MARALALLPARVQGGLRLEDSTTWGGNVLEEHGAAPGGGTRHHLFVAEMVEHCGLTTWRQNSRIVRAVSDEGVLGPYERAQEVVPVWSHNPQVLRMPKGDLLLFHIGSGTEGLSHPPKMCPAAPHGTTPCREKAQHQMTFAGKHQSQDAKAATRLQHDKNESFPFTFPLHHAESLAGPWQSHEAAISFDVGDNANPSPVVFPNGTVLILFHALNFAIAESVGTDWRGPYKLRSTKACGAGEDPFLYIDQRGYFHCLSHAAPFSHPRSSIVHSFSRDGYTWTVSKTGATAGSEIDYGAAHGKVLFSKRERPKLMFNEKREITHLISGVTLTPECTPRFLYSDGVDGKLPDACQNETMQYHLSNRNPCPGHFDRGFTLIQEVETRATASTHEFAPMAES
ncbi:Hypothetical Protein FCC1311_024312 [Hondaea fermentalgiana]|uniref:Uncharacterized protein n=1 Tax=Hondaea fermentalgiana TaxID=2315210 RepID=A0A2R5G5F2_9STRA|nr:Hypothetical Protein FCC1311_024312 [Hondaea fermentalgiana]|eukprot:GBG26210.1 Hypothetical Protein FCC1311_024312 [Hondaea fermentalgiana]